MAQSKASLIKSAVDGFFNKAVSLDDTAMALTGAGVAFTAIQSTIQTIGVKNDWILTPEKIKAKVEATIEGKTISHFLDVVQLAKNLDLAQLSQAEKEKAIVEFSGVKSSDVKEGKKFKQLHNSGNFGAICNWIKENPDFTAEQIHNSGLVTAPNASDYYDEPLAWREFFRTINSQA